MANHLNDKYFLRYDVAIDVAGELETVGLHITRDDSRTPFQGTVVLIHGFKASKEFMTNSALYFRFLGFDVLIPDLLGHGDSDGNIKFGVKDSQSLNELINVHSTFNLPLFIVGNSMGALTASYLASKRTDVSGLILQAPMVIFDDAVVNYITSYSPNISDLLSEESMRKGATNALNSANVTLEQTDIKHIIAGLDIPVLIFASSSDPVAPFTYFQPMANSNISVLKTAKRSHPGMSVIGEYEHNAIQTWL